MLRDIRVRRTRSIPRRSSALMAGDTLPHADFAVRVRSRRRPRNDILNDTPEYSAHASAIVEPGARIGAGTSIWHHAHVRTGAVIGTGCTLGQNAFVDTDVRVGDRVKIENNASVHAGVTLADEVFVGPGVVFTNDRYPRSASTDWVPVATTVGRGASIGANATVIGGSDIGEYALVGAGSVVTRAVTDYELVMGNPARHAGWVCRCGRIVNHDDARPAVLTCERCA
jgi:acetyltransferase-like isoleucine patch superfamily enzyme